MIKDNKLLDELARIASGAASTAHDVRNQAQAEMRERLERLFEQADLARNEDVVAVREMAAQAREEQEALAQRVESLEARLAALEAGSAGKTSGGTGRSRSGTGGAKKSSRSTGKSSGAQGDGTQRGDGSNSGGSSG